VEVQVLGALTVIACTPDLVAEFVAAFIHRRMNA
jgi:hypothetical protein